MKKTRIVYILHGLASGGTDAFVMNVVKALDKDRYDITFILALDDKGHPDQFREQEALDLGAHIYRTCDLDGISKKLLHYKKLKKVLRDNGPFDVVHGNMDLFNAINLMAAKKAGVGKRICHSHTSDSQYAINPMKKIVSGVYRLVMKKLIWKNATVMLGCSELANDYLYGKKWRDSPKCHVLYNGIDLEGFHSKGLDIEKYRERLGVPANGRRYLMTVGRFVRLKNPRFLYELVKALHDLDQSVYFTWVGGGDMKEEIEDLARRDGADAYMSFLGTRKDIQEIMKCNEGFLFPSFFEGLPIALIEAQAAGLACFASDVITGEVNIGKCRYLSLDKGAKEWAKIILKELPELERQKTDAEKEAGFDIHRTVKQLERYYG